MSADRVFGASMVIDPTCEECGGEDPTAEEQCGEGWVLTGYATTELADGTKRMGQADMRPCSQCKAPQYRRWRRGHYPCPRGGRGGMCGDCKREHGEKSIDEDEHMPVQDTRYEPEAQQESFLPPS